MRLTNLHRAFGGTSETVKVEDPWGNGIEFETRHAGWPPFVRAQHDAGKKMSKSVGRAATKLAARAIREGRELDFSAEAIQAEVVGMLENDSIDVSDVIGSADGSEMAGWVAKHLLVGWSGLNDGETDKPVPFSEAAALELLTYAADAGEAYPGKTVGEVLTETILNAAKAQQSIREATEEDAGKNSLRSPDGTTPSVTGSGRPKKITAVDSSTVS